MVLIFQFVLCYCFSGDTKFIFLVALDIVSKILKNNNNNKNCEGNDGNCTGAIHRILPPIQILDFMSMTSLRLKNKIKILLDQLSSKDRVLWTETRSACFKVKVAYKLFARGDNCAAREGNSNYI